MTVTLSWLATMQQQGFSLTRLLQQQQWQDFAHTLDQACQVGPPVVNDSLDWPPCSLLALQCFCLAAMQQQQQQQDFAHILDRVC